MLNHLSQYEHVILVGKIKPIHNYKNTWWYHGKCVHWNHISCDVKRWHIFIYSSCGVCGKFSWQTTDRGWLSKWATGWWVGWWGEGASLDVCLEIRPRLWCSLARGRTSLSADNWNRKPGRKGSFSKEGRLANSLGLWQDPPHSRSGETSHCKSITHTHLEAVEREIQTRRADRRKHLWARSTS